MSVRLDKWLQISRIFKTRSQATRACTLKRVRVNGKTAKAHRSLKVEDKIEVRKGDWTRIIVVRELREKSVPKAVAATLFEDQSPPRPRSDPVQRILSQPIAHRERGRGAPTKKERREIDKLMGR